MINTPGSSAKVRGQTTSTTNQAFYVVVSHGPVDLLQDGSASQKYTFKCDWPSLFKWMPFRGFTPSPDFPALICESATASYENPGVAVVVVTFRGIPGPSLPPGDEEMVVSTQEQPIETHPLFVTVLAGKPSAPLNGAIFDGTSDTTSAFLRFAATSPYAGIESYLSPTMTYRRNYSSYSRPDITSVGFIWIPTNAPGSGGRTWLCTGVTWRKYGGYYSVNEDSLLSGVNGWVPEIYTNP